VEVVHLDPSIVVVHKPEGMLVHRGMGATRQEVFLLQAVRDLLGERVFPVHRLDRPTGGLVVLGRSSQAARHLQNSWKSGRVRKTYQAIARGWMADPAGLRDEALDDPDSGIVHEARSTWRELDRCEIPFPLPASRHPTSRFCLLELEPLTGRWHQLRRHLSRMHHPIAGDTTHGDRHVNHFLHQHFGWWRLMLWAKTLEFPHPETDQTMSFQDPSRFGLEPNWRDLSGS